MGLAVVTVGGAATIGAGPVYTAVTPATGDSFQVGQFNASNDTAKLEGLSINGVVNSHARIRSPRMADDTYGISTAFGLAPAHLAFEEMAAEQLYPGDQLTVELLGTAADVYAVALTTYYSNLPGADASLKMWGDISGSIDHIISREVACSTPSAAGIWSDTLVNTTEALYKANAYYAVLGYTCTTGICAVAVRASETGNYRVGGPGVNRSEVTANWFVDQSNAHQTPHIPVFNANNQNQTYVSIIDNAATAGVTVSLILAQLSTTFTP